MNKLQEKICNSSRDHAIKLARESALAHCQQHEYLPQSREAAQSWQPHEWVVLALQSAVLDSAVAAFDREVIAQEITDESPTTQDPSEGSVDAPHVPDTADVRLILGRMCFQCIRIAKVLRIRGDEIAHRAEDEQAAVLRFLLNHYLASPDQWAERVQEEINAILERAQATGAEVSE